MRFLRSSLFLIASLGAFLGSPAAPHVYAQIAIAAAPSIPSTDPNKGNYQANPLPTDAYVSAFDRAVWNSVPPAAQALQSMGMGSSDRVQLFNALVQSGVLKYNDPQIFAYGMGPYFQIRTRNMYHELAGYTFPASWLTSTDISDYPAYLPPVSTPSNSFLCAAQGKMIPSGGVTAVPAFSPCPGDSWPIFVPRSDGGHSYMKMTFGEAGPIGGQIPVAYFQIQ